MPNQTQATSKVGPVAAAGGLATTAAGGNAFKDLKGATVRLSPEIPAGYPVGTPASGFIGSRKRTASEEAQQCMMYAYSVDWKRVQPFNHFHFARLEGTTLDGQAKVFSWVNGTPDTRGGTGHLVVYSTLSYLALCGFAPSR